MSSETHFSAYNGTRVYVLDDVEAWLENRIAISLFGAAAGAKESRKTGAFPLRSNNFSHTARRVLNPRLSQKTAIGEFMGVSDSTHAIYSELEVVFDGKESIENFVQLGLDLDHFHPQPGINRILLQREEIQILQDNNIAFKITVDDVASAIERRNIEYLENNPIPESEKTTAGFELGSMGGFYTYAEVLAQLDEMKTLYPALITDKFSIGTSVEGRTIWAVKISDNPNTDESAAEAPVYFDALHHAREPASMATVINYMFHLLENYSTDPGLQYIVDNREIFVVPVVNPDGYEYNRQTNPNGGGLWRKNRRVNSGTSCRGVDLNRNYNTDWSNASSNNPCSSGYHGPSAFSEPESQAIRDFTTSINAPIAYTTHTSGGYWLGPDFSNGRPDFAIHAELMSDCMDENEYIYGDADVILGYVSGTTQLWMYESIGSLSWTPEIGTTGFWPAVPEIIPLVNQQIKPYTYACWVAGALADYQGFEITSSQGLSAGSTLDLDVTVKNKGLSRTAQNVNVVVSSDNAGVSVVSGDQSYGNIASRALAKNTSSFSFTVSPSVPVGTVVKFYAEVSQEGVVSDLDSFNIVVGQPTILFSDGAEAGSSAWSNGGSGSTWQTSTEDSYSGTSCFVDSRIGHVTGARTFTTNAGISLAGASNPRLEFAAKWSLYQRYTRLQISVNGGGWSNLSTSSTETVSGGPGFVGNERWTFQVVDLSPFTGQSVRFRFANSGGGTNPDGFYFDDFRVVDYAAGSSCSDGIQNGDETGVDCGGSDCAACVTCSDGIQNGNETGVDCGGPDCAACATCSDGIQNGDETGVDCGGPDCAACDTGCTTVTLQSDDFEAGYGNWNDGGSDCIRTSNTTYANSGAISVLIRDNTSTSVLTTNSLDLSSYDEISVDFSFYPLSMDNSSEDFWLQVSTNGGGSYTTVEEWNRGDEFQNGIRYFESVTLAGPFTTNTRIRFRCDASGNADYIYLDDIVLSACEGGGGSQPSCTDGIRNGNETDVDCGGPDCAACPTCNDGIQNGNETGVDCGGPDCIPCQVNYCASSATSTQYEHIASVTIAGVTIPTGNDSGYGDYTGTQVIPLNGTVSLSLTPGFAGGAYTEGWVVWVDFNADGDFTDPGERALELSGSSTVSGTIAVPSGLSGTSRMRIQMRYNAYNGSSCGTYAEGEVEDYMVTFGGGTRRIAPPTGTIPDVSAPEMELFPNPVSTGLTVRITLTEELGDVPWRVIDASGKVVLRGKAISETLRSGLSIDVSSLSAGMYYFSLKTSTINAAGHFIILSR